MLMAHCGMSLLLGAKDYDWGMAVVQAAVEANPNNLLIVARAGIANLFAGNIEDALTYLHRANRLSPGDPGAHFSLTGIAHGADDPRELRRGADLGHPLPGEQPEFPSGPLDRDSSQCASWPMGRGAPFSSRAQRRSRRASTVASIRASQPYKDPSRFDAILDGLRLAGLDES